MIKHYIKFFGCILITLFSLQAVAKDMITIKVRTNEKTAAAIGYTVGGKNSGGAGKSYVGKGPKNKRYSFGYRKNSVTGKDISCGSLTLTRSANVSLITKGKKCMSVRK